jgi:hypothetical protein
MWYSNRFLKSNNGTIKQLLIIVFFDIIMVGLEKIWFV